MLQTSPFIIQLGPSHATSTLTEHPLLINDQVVNIACVPNGIRSFTCGDNQAFIKELAPNDGAGEGAACWLSGIAFFATLNEYSEVLRGASVLDIGCGTGLGGITASLYGHAEKVVFIDSDYKLEPVVNANATLHNSCVNTTFVLSTYETLCGGGNVSSEVDCVLALDCVYKGNMTAVAHAIIRGLRAGGQAIIINPIRTGLLPFVYTLMERGKVEISEILVTFGTAKTTLQRYIFTKDEDIL